MDGERERETCEENEKVRGTEADEKGDAGEQTERDEGWVSYTGMGEATTMRGN